MSTLHNVGGADSRDSPAVDRSLDPAYTATAWRVMPLLMGLFMVACIDRFNVGFAKLTMLADLHMSEAAYGVGAGIFFVGYLIFEIPSNMYLQKVGAKRTLARIAILWGIVSMATAFVHTEKMFLFLRFLLGACEAGLYPGGILYMTLWFPARKRAQLLGLFTGAATISGIIGGPIAGMLLDAMSHRPGGLASWQWLFILEGIPSVLLGVVTMFVMIDKIDNAKWLTSDQKARMKVEIDRDGDKAPGIQKSFFALLRWPTFWLFVISYFFLVSANPTLGFWGPTLIRGMGVTNVTTIGFLAAIPYIAGAISMVLVGRHSDRTGERRWHTAGSTLVCAIAMIVMGFSTAYPYVAFVALVVAAAAVLSAFGPFWQIPNAAMTGAAAAGGIAVINSIGNMSGLVGPALVGWLRDLTGGSSPGLFAVAGMELLATILVLYTLRPKKPVKAQQS